jgi:hypothetical protein
VFSHAWWCALTLCVYYQSAGLLHDTSTQSLMPLYCRCAAQLFSDQSDLRLCGIDTSNRTAAPEVGGAEN